MNPADDIAAFLTTRRARITPEQAGLTAYGERRVPGLRREEVASLAGVSVQYYTRLERGQAGGASDLVLEALARALQLDDDERGHLFDLVRATSPVAVPAPVPRPGTAVRIRPLLQQLLGELAAPAIISHIHGDFLAGNALGRALYSPIFESREQPPNSSRFIFLDPAARTFYPGWEQLADDVVANLRWRAGRNPHDASLHALIGELTTRSEAFGQRWNSHDVRVHRDGTKVIHHPIVGAIELRYEAMQLDVDEDLRLALYTTDPGSPSRQALDLLASWTATTDAASHASPPGEPGPEH